MPLTPSEQQQLFGLSVLSLPVVVGLIAMAVNIDAADNFTRNITGWASRRRQECRSTFSRYCTKVFLSMAVLFYDLTNKMKHGRLRNGLRVALFFGVLEGYVLTILAIIGLMIAIFMLVMMISVLAAMGRSRSGTIYVSRPNIFGFRRFWISDDRW